MNRIIYLVFTLCVIALQATAQVTLENRHFRYEIGNEGENLHFIDKSKGQDYLSRDSVSRCAYAGRGQKTYGADRASLDDGRLHLRFGDSGIAAVIRVETSENRINWKVEQVTGAPTSLIFLNIPLTLKGFPDEPFAACALSMNLQTRVQQLPPLQNQLQASCYERFGLIGSEVNLIGVQQAEMLPVIREIMTAAEDLPFSDQGGAWASLGKEGYGSYLMQFGDLTEQTVDDWIARCRQIGFNQIDNHGGGKGFFTFGDLVLNPEKWPDGWQSFRRINDKLHRHGISSILHTYSFFMDKSCSYVTPVPSRDLGFFKSFTLAEPIGAEDTFVPVQESTAGISTIVGFFEQNSVSLRIGDEIIEFQGAAATPPYGFTGCRRGALGTEARPHAAADTLYHLREQYGRFVPDPSSALFREIAKKTADVVNECGFDGIYFDAIDGCRVLGNREDSWYYGTDFLLEVARHLKKPVGMEMSDMFHHWWHYRSRWVAWDAPRRGYKPFIDLHLDVIKGGDPDDFTPDQRDRIRERSRFDAGRNRLPIHLGWFGLSTGEDPQIEATFPDDVEYLCCKMLGNNAGASLLYGEDFLRKMQEIPAFQRLAEIFRRYETLRQQHYFDDSIRERLKEPGREFTLEKEGRKWVMKPARYVGQNISGLDTPSATWTVENPFEAQPLKLRIELQMSVKPYEDPDHIVLADYRNVPLFQDRKAAEGVASSIASCDDPRFGEPSLRLCAYNLAAQSPRSSWTKARRDLGQPIDLFDHQALGFWIKGDGKGELLNVRLLSPRHISYGARGDRLIPVDFTGWRYVELVENDGAEAFGYDWDAASRRDYYPFFREQLNFGQIDGLQFSFNRLPRQEEVNCLLSPVHALPLVRNTVAHPSLTVGGETLVFPVTMESGMYLELDRTGMCTLYSVTGEVLQQMKMQEKIPVMQHGENRISFSCGETKDVRCRARVTIASFGAKL